mmetsp:Transcript_28025/g.57531  ORF Transcript_28025/g.57531 Transcript_28025/m.57531 type:complete len:222 (-) Transcript_28025:274-939(-)
MPMVEFTHLADCMRNATCRCIMAASCVSESSRIKVSVVSPFLMEASSYCSFAWSLFAFLEASCDDSRSLSRSSSIEFWRCFCATFMSSSTRMAPVPISSTRTWWRTLHPALSLAQSTERNLSTCFRVASVFSVMLSNISCCSLGIRPASSSKRRFVSSKRSVMRWFVNVRCSVPYCWISRTVSLKKDRKVIPICVRRAFSPRSSLSRCAIFFVKSETVASM